MTEIDRLKNECLARFEGHDYEPGKPRFAWHVHHDKLADLLAEPVINRVNFIIAHKPAHQVATRLKWLRPVVGEVPADLVKAWDVRDKARSAYYNSCYKTQVVYNEGWETCAKSRVAHAEARDACDKARAAYAKARDAYVEELKMIHDKELPGCPWDGKAMVFPDAAEAAKEENNEF